MTRLNELMEYYKAVSLYDKTINEKKQPSIRRSYAHLTVSYSSFKTTP